jgi:hypothetical protein
MPRPKARRLFPDVIPIAKVLLPESFRGGCSFGAGIKPVSPDAIVMVDA